MWDIMDTHGKKTLSLTNLTSQHDQAATRASDEMKYIILTNRGDSLTLGTMHCVVPVVSVEA